MVSSQNPKTAEQSKTPAKEVKPSTKAGGKPIDEGDKTPKSTTPTPTPTSISASDPSVPSENLFSLSDKAGHELTDDPYADLIKASSDGEGSAGTERKQ